VRASTAVVVELDGTVWGRTEPSRSPERECDSRNGLEVERSRNQGGRYIVGSGVGVADIHRLALRRVVYLLRL
jgi:hypothetical protein